MTAIDASTGSPNGTTGDATTITNTGVTSAFMVGWRLAEVYNQSGYANTPPDAAAALPEHLPGEGEMTMCQRAVVRLKYVEKVLKGLEITFGEDSDVKPGVIASSIERQKTADTRRNVLQLFVQIRDSLSASNPPAATALGLGRMLADTCLLPNSTDPAKYQTEFAHARLQNAYDWLAELSQLLPPNAATTVTGSLKAWEAWVQTPGNTKQDQKAISGSRAGAYGESTTIRLRHQGNLWRRILAGEQDPKKLLDPDDYVNAGIGMLERFRAIARTYVLRWKVGIIVAVLFVVGIGAATVYLAHGSDKAFGVVISAIAALGVTWKGLGATLGKALTEVQKPIWETEVAQAMVLSATRLPSADEISKAPAPAPPMAPVNANGSQPPAPSPEPEPEPEAIGV
jgi:hypothetical protein